MNILLLNYEYPPVGGGAATATRALAHSLTTLGHKPIVLTARFGDLPAIAEEDGVRVIRVSSHRSRQESASIFEMISFVLAAGSAVRRIIRSEHVDGIISFFSIPGGPVAWWAWKGTDVPYIVSLRGGDVPGAERGLHLLHTLLSPVRRQVLRSALAVVANSEGLRTMSSRADPVPVSVIPNGVDTDFFRPADTTRAAGAPFRLLFVGRFQPQKNLVWMLKQIAAVVSESVRPLELDLVGDGPQRRELEEIVKNLQHGPIVRFHGWLDRRELRELYQAADLTLNPSLYEGMPNVVLEAMACGCPVLASRVAGNDAVVLDGVTGWLFALGDTVAFRDRINALIAHPEIALQFRVGSRRRAVEGFSWLKTAQSYLDLLATPHPTCQSA